MASLASSTSLPRAAIRPPHQAVSAGRRPSPYCSAASFPASRLSSASALSARICLPPLPALSPKRRSTAVRAAAAPAADGTLTRVAQAVYKSALPAGFATGLGLTELSVVLFLRESMIALATLVIVYSAPKICRVLNHVWGSYVMRDEEVTEEEFQDSMFGALIHPLQFALVAAFLSRHVHLLVPALRAQAAAAAVGKVRGAAVVVAAAWFASGWKDRIIKLAAASHPQDKPVLVNVNVVLTLLVRVVAAVTIADMFGVSFKSLLAIGGISGLAIGLASEAIVSNFFGGLVLFLTRPFVVGEKIRVAGLKGKVLEIGFLQTKLEADDNSPILVPNALFNKATILNITRAGCRLMDATFVLRNEDVVRVRPITRALTAYVQAHPRVDRSKGPAMAFLKALTGSGLQIGVTACIKDMSKGKFLPVQQEILEKSVEIIEGEGALLGESAPFDPNTANGTTSSSYVARKNLLWQRRKRSAE
ncbi:hypothetical protein CLOM_g10359 [Closterium sp. NIES-68]|nr:hypothetical protein CLOM_g10359 [Closterium sp. NIES-68]GJP75804.1 hypothetical protein CLOP_g6204 [Closterium sp. NIES-67]